MCSFSIYLKLIKYCTPNLLLKMTVVKVTACVCYINDVSAINNSLVATRKSYLTNAFIFHHFNKHILTTTALCKRAQQLFSINLNNAFPLKNAAPLAKR